MNQILDIAGSYLIGGIVLAALVGLTFHFSAKSQENKLSEIAQRTTTEMGSVMEHDFGKMGYRVSADDKILNLTASSITFLADINNNGTPDTIYYTLSKSGDQPILQRRVSLNNQVWTAPVQDFIVRAFDDENILTGILDEVKSISVEMTLKEKSFKYSSGEVSGSWKRHFFPKNL